MSKELRDVLNELKDTLEKLSKVLQEEEVNKIPYIPVYPPYPYYPFPQTPQPYDQFAFRGCNICGQDIRNMANYVCNNSQCPSKIVWQRTTTNSGSE